MKIVRAAWIQPVRPPPNWSRIGPTSPAPRPDPGGERTLPRKPNDLLAHGGPRAAARRQAGEVLGAIRRHIDEGRLREGERIAPERDLAAQFGVSRSVVRSALAELHRNGLIARKVGHGTIVLPRAEPAQMLPILDTSPAELLDFRIAFEPGMAEAIVLNASARDIARIWACVEGGDTASGTQEWERWDSSFHHSLIAATHNRLAITLYDAVARIRHAQPWLTLKQGHTDERRWSAYQDEHRRIAECLTARDATGAAAALREHLHRVRAKMLGPG